MSDIDAIIANVLGHDRGATPGPWRKGVLWHDGAYPVGPYTRNEQQANADAALIAYYRTAAPALAAEVERLRAEVERDKCAAIVPRPGAEWDEDMGPVLWWKFPIIEPPYVGSPLDDDFPPHVTHFTPILLPEMPE